MNNTLVEDLLGSPSGTIVTRDVDLLMGHDGTASLIVDRFVKDNSSVWDPSKVMLVFDHFSAPASIDRANIQRKLVVFAKDNALPFKMSSGICHQLLMEDDRVSPGKLIIGADSHTTTAGAVGALATGVGATDFYDVLSTGKIWLKVPKTTRVLIKGRVPNYIQGKDIVLELLRRIGPDGANYQCLEFCDQTDNGISIDSRATICNMAVDLGAKFGFFVTDQVTQDYIAERGGEYQTLLPSSRANYENILSIDITNLLPMVSKSATEVLPVNDLIGTKVDQVFLGSCTAGRLEDLAVIARILEGRTVHPHVKTIVIPASKRVLEKALSLGYIDHIVKAGAILANSSCGPCCNIDKGVLGDGEVCISTSNRNYPGRMGSLTSQTLLASTLTAVAASLSGEITDPRNLIS